MEDGYSDEEMYDEYEEEEEEEEEEEDRNGGRRPRWESLRCTQSPLWTQVSQPASLIWGQLLCAQCKYICQTIFVLSLFFKAERKILSSKATLYIAWLSYNKHWKSQIVQYCSKHRKPEIGCQCWQWRWSNGDPMFCTEWSVSMAT